MLEMDLEQQAAALLARNPAGHTELDDPEGVARLLGALREAGAEQQLRTLVERLPADTGDVTVWGTCLPRICA